MTITVILFVFGLVVGSFLNVVALRWDGKNFGGRSKCGSCDKPLHWWELIPVVSYVALRGKCSKCGSSISLQYPLVELWTGLIFATISPLLIPIFCLYIVISIYDFHHKIIPDPLVYSSIVLALLINLLNFSNSSNLIAGAILFSFFALLWLSSRGRLMGFGDAKLALSLGLLLGVGKGVYAVILAFWLGAAVGIFLMLFNRKDITMKTEIPFGPFLVLGAWLSLLFNFNFLYVL